MAEIGTGSAAWTVTEATPRWGMCAEEGGVTTATPPSMKLLLRVDEARAVLSLNRNAMYRLLMSEAIYSFKEGGVRLVPAAELEAYVARRVAERLAERHPIAAASAPRQAMRPADGRGTGVAHGR